MTTFELKNKFLSLASEAEAKSQQFLKLSYTQINWRPGESQWSIGECFEHLIRTNMNYIQAYQNNILDGNADKEIEFKPTLMGGFILKYVKPENVKKYKTASAFNPAGSEIKKDIIKDFLDQNNKAAELAKALDSEKIKVKIYSPFAKLVKYSIGDSLLVVGYHNLRHIQQAERVMQNKNFPSS